MNCFKKIIITSLFGLVVANNVQAQLRPAYMGLKGLTNTLGDFYIKSLGGSGTNIFLAGDLDIPAGSGGTVLLRDFTVVPGTGNGLILYSKNTDLDNPVLGETGLTTDGNTLGVPGLFSPLDNIFFANPDTGIILDGDTMMFIRSSNGEIILGSGGEPGFDLSTPNWAFNDGYFRGLQPNQQIILTTNIIAQTWNFQTLNATPAAAVTLATETGSVWNITVLVAAAQEDYSEAAGYYKAYTVRNFEGTTTVVGSTRDLMLPNEDNATWDVTIGESDPNIVITVTGEAATVNWSFTISAAKVHTP